MSVYVLVGLGGAAGSIARFEIGRQLARVKGFPRFWGTLLINSLGAFLLGLLNASHLTDRFTHLLGDGFLGAFTTFSTLTYEGAKLSRGGKHRTASAYLTLSVILGGIGYLVGNAIGQVVL